MYPLIQNVFILEKKRVLIKVLSAWSTYSLKLFSHMLSTCTMTPISALVKNRLFVCTLLATYTCHMYVLVQYINLHFFQHVIEFRQL